MEREELIKTLRWCGGENNEWCVRETYKCPLWNEDRITDECKAELMTTAADALEAADKRIAEMEAQLPKEGEWIDENRRTRSSKFVCSACKRTCYDIQPTRDKAWTKRCRYNYCPNCGAKMKTVTDCHTLEEANDE